MKKLTLALALALGVANVNAVAPKVSAEADLEARIRSANITDADKANVLTWVKDHKVITTAATVLLVLSLVGTADHFLNEAKLRTAVSEFIANNGGTWTKDTAVAGWDWTAEHAKAGYETAADNKVLVGTSVLGTVALLLSIYDLRKEADRSALKTLWASLTAKLQSTEANVPA